MTAIAVEEMGLNQIVSIQSEDTEPRMGKKLWPLYILIRINSQNTQKHNIKEKKDLINKYASHGWGTFL